MDDAWQVIRVNFEECNLLNVTPVTLLATVMGGGRGPGGGGGGVSKHHAQPHSHTHTHIQVISDNGEDCHRLDVTPSTSLASVRKDVAAAFKWPDAELRCAGRVRNSCY